MVTKLSGQRPVIRQGYRTVGIRQDGLIHRLILEELKNSEHVGDLIYIRVRVDLYMQVIRKGLDFGPISSAWGVVYFTPRDSQQQTKQFIFAITAELYIFHWNFHTEISRQGFCEGQDRQRLDRYFRFIYSSSQSIHCKIRLFLFFLYKSGQALYILLQLFNSPQIRKYCSYKRKNSAQIKKKDHSISSIQNSYFQILIL